MSQHYVLRKISHRKTSTLLHRAFLIKPLQEKGLMLS